MSYTIKEKLANKGNYGGQRSTSAIRYIVIHYTANDGDTDEGNGNYFKNNVTKTSAHYFVDSDSVTRSVPDDYIAWSVGGSKHADSSTTGGGRLHGVCTNTNSISIEICDDVKNGTIYPSAATIENALELTKALMAKYNVPAERVIRHFDVTGKACPAYWCGNTAKNAQWLSEFHDKLSGADETPMLGEGDKGEAVKRLQSRLNEWGFTLDADGDFGPKTLAAVKEFQRLTGLDADGIVGPLTWAKLNEEVQPLNETKFSDISGSYAEQAINELADMGIVQGYEDGTFKPEQPVTRAEAAVIIRNTVKYITGK